MKANSELLKLPRDFLLDNVTPSNSAEAISLILEGVEAQFEYTNNSDDIIRARVALESVNQDALTELGKDRLERTRIEIEAVEAIGTEHFTELSDKLYPRPNEEQVALAKHILALTVPEEHQSLTISADEAARKFNEVLSSVAPEWKAVRVPGDAPLRVETNQKVLMVSDEPYSEEGLQRLILHEIGAHILRYENGTKGDDALLEVGTANYEFIEEGVSTYTEWRGGLLSIETVRQYAARLLAVHAASTMSGKQVFEMLKQYVSEQNAATITMRVKRGLESTKNHGGYSKDSIYFSGLMRMMRLSKHHPELWGGRFDLDDKIPCHENDEKTVRLLKQYGVENKEIKRKIKTYFQLKK